MSFEVKDFTSAQLNSKSGDKTWMWKKKPYSVPMKQVIQRNNHVNGQYEKQVLFSYILKANIFTIILHLTKPIGNRPKQQGQNQLSP